LQLAILILHFLQMFTRLMLNGVELQTLEW